MRQERKGDISPHPALNLTLRPYLLRPFCFLSLEGGSQTCLIQAAPACTIADEGETSNLLS
jgi:hypothetical protein